MANESTISGSGSELDVEFTPDKATESRFIGAKADDAATAKLSGARQAVREEAGKLSGQATDKVRAFAVDGKDKASGALDGVAKVIGDAAGTLDTQVGEKFGGYARQASSAVSDFAERLRNKDVDDIVADAKTFVKTKPAIAIGAAAAVGFVLARILRSGVDENRRA